MYRDFILYVSTRGKKSPTLSLRQCVERVCNVVAFGFIQASILPIEFDDFSLAAIQMESDEEIDSQQQTTDQSNCLSGHQKCV